MTKLTAQIRGGLDHSGREFRAHRSELPTIPYTVTKRIELLSYGHSSASRRDGWYRNNNRLVQYLVYSHRNSVKESRAGSFSG